MCRIERSNCKNGNFAGTDGESSEGVGEETRGEGERVVNIMEGTSDLKALAQFFIVRLVSIFQEIDMPKSIHDNIYIP